MTSRRRSSDCIFKSYALFQVPEARILKYTESNLEKLRALKREHEVNARATKAAAAKRKQEQLEAAKSIR